MNRTFAMRWLTSNHRDVLRLLLGVLISVGAPAACTVGADSDGEVGTRLTSGAGAAGQILSGEFTPSQSQGGDLEALGRMAPTGPPGGDVSVGALGVDFGSAEAPLRMIEFFDYGCGYCRAFHQETRGPLHEEYVDPGQVLWKSIPFILGRWPESIPVSLAAECARDQGRDYFEAISDLLFERQGDWKAASAPEAVAEAYAEEVGLDMPRYRSCIASDEFLWRVQAHTALATEVGVRGTPTFFIVDWGPIPGALPLETFRQVLDTVLVEVAAGRP